MDKVWLDGLKPGDLVSWTSRTILGERLVIAKVKRRTKTQIIVTRQDTQWKFRAKTGDRVGATDWNAEMLMPVTEDVVNQHKRQRIIDKLCSMKWSELSDKKLFAINEIIRGE